MSRKIVNVGLATPSALFGEPEKAPEKKKYVRPSRRKPETKPAEVAKHGSCSICGKPLSRLSSQSQGMGDICMDKVKYLPTGISLVEYHTGLMVDEVPAGYLKFQDALKLAVKAGISGYRFLQATGGDRGIRKPYNEHFKIVYYCGSRWLPGTCVNYFDELKIQR